MSRLRISCGSCGQSWTVATPFSVYEQQALESNPCPCCDSYTLCCNESEQPPAGKWPFQQGSLKPVLARP